MAQEFRKEHSPAALTGDFLWSSPVGCGDLQSKLPVGETLSRRSLAIFEHDRFGSKRARSYQRTLRDNNMYSDYNKAASRQNQARAYGALT